jgi:hypothetical protein
MGPWPARLVCVAAQGVWVPVRCRSRTMATASCWVSLAPAENALLARRPAVRVELTDEAPYAQLLVSVRDSDSTVAAIRGATGA